MEPAQDRVQWQVLESITIVLVNNGNHKVKYESFPSV
jgi:hypothetical protein